MGKSVSETRPVRLFNLGKRDMRAQFGALCWRRRGDKIQVLLVTSRERGRWVIPKGWPMDGKTPAEAASIEAFEEAGVRGVVGERSVGVYTYIKELDSGDLPVVVAVFPLEVTKELDDWPEKAERKRRWISLSKASKELSDHELGRILNDPTLPKLLK